MAWDHFKDDILGAGLRALRRRMRVQRLITTGLEKSLKGKGDTISFPSVGYPGPAYDVVPGHLPTAATVLPTTQISIKLDQHKAQSFPITDLDRFQRDLSTDAGPQAIENCIYSISQSIEEYIFDGIRASVPYIHLNGGAPIAAVTEDDISDLKLMLDQQLAPAMVRSLMASPNAEGDLLKREAFKFADRAGRDEYRRTGSLGQYHGIDILGNNQVIKLHKTGITAAHAVNDANGVRVGDTTVDLDGSVRAPLPGDRFRFAAAAGWKVVRSVTGAGSEWHVTFAPAAVTADVVANDATIQAVVGNHYPSLVFSRECYAFGSAPLENDGPGEFRSISDPNTGIVLRLEVSRQNKQDKWEFDVLYGGGVRRPEFGAVLCSI